MQIEVTVCYKDVACSDLCEEAEALSTIPQITTMEVRSHSQDAVPIRLVRDAIGESIASKPHLQMFCSDTCILRFLRARGMDPVKAASMLSETLQWYVLVPCISQQVPVVDHDMIPGLLAVYS